MEAITRDWRTAPLAAPDRALCEFAEKLTRAPWTIASEDVDTLRRQGFGDEDVNDAAQVVSFFNYINRIADGLGVDLEPGMTQKAEDRRQ